MEKLLNTISKEKQWCNENTEKILVLRSIYGDFKCVNKQGMTLIYRGEIEQKPPKSTSKSTVRQRM